MKVNFYLFYCIYDLKRLSESLPIIDSIHSVLFVGRDLAMIEL